MWNKRFIQLLVLIIILFFIFNKELFYERFLAINSSKPIQSEENLNYKNNLMLFKTFIGNKFNNVLYNFDDTAFNPDFNVFYYYNKQFQDITILNLKNILSSSPDFKNYKFKSTGDISNIKSKDVGNDRHFIFTVELFDNVQMFVVTLEIYLIIKDINLYLANGSYQIIINIPDEAYLLANIRVINKPIDLSYNYNYEALPIYEFQYYSTINNALYLA